MSLSSQPIRRSKSLHEQTYQALRTNILSGRLAPGDRLVETHLAQALQVSRTPIREAMRQLQREGLIIGDAQEGLRVTSISVIDTKHLYDCRMGLEQVSILGACQYASAEELHMIERYVLQAEKLMQRPDSELNSFQLLDLDYQFHHAIAVSSGNPWLVTLLDQVFDKMTLLRAQTTRQNPKVLEIRVEHRQIYQAIADRDVEAAAAAMQRHLMTSKVRVVQEVEHFYQVE
ncbi:MAG: GntR family transcriptional regulator [Drouetiella hepatica Uher 2000/2452]|uniref:GntR family transcriptional regulator n=1 Tax=Drouetiella hepatica Uher 2000/2452 TaxID=904376 RepID=A0A951QAI1_9CYAN|nr:GntR family transcriptional regulator [Drouetiella hepatica Uher 2000/2452]